MRLRLLTFVLVSAFLATLCSVSEAQQAATPRIQSTPEPLKTLPQSVFDAELRSVGSDMFRLSEYSGKVLVIHLWATWCGPCRFEAPVFVKLHEEFRDLGVEIVDLSTENPNLATVEIKKWIRSYGVPYRSGFASTHVAVILMRGRNVLPQTFVISRSGLILKHFIGFNLNKTGLLIKKAIEDALKETGDERTAP